MGLIHNMYISNAYTLLEECVNYKYIIIMKNLTKFLDVKST